ncbi:MAG TPA: hypothetical protein VGK73_25740 [Polyangiaceae bacterium]
MASPDLTLDVWRTAVVALCEYACGYEAGRSKDDPVYVEVTEERDGPGPQQRASYSSCGDLAHWLYKRLGIRQEWINRTDDDAFGPWKASVNVTRLWGGACPFDEVPPAKADWMPDPGDVVLIWNTGKDAHVMVALGREGSSLRTANYGAGGMSAAVSPGARIASKEVTYRNGKPFYGEKQIQRYLPLSAAVRHISVAPDLTGARLAGEQLDAIALGWNATAVVV